MTIKHGDDSAIGHNTSALETRSSPTAPRPLRRAPRALITSPGAARQDAIPLAHVNRRRAALLHPNFDSRVSTPHIGRSRLVLDVTIKLGDDSAIGHNTSALETRSSPTTPRPRRRTPRAPTTRPGAARQDAIALVHVNRRRAALLHRKFVPRVSTPHIGRSRLVLDVTIKHGDNFAIGHNTSAPETRSSPTAPRPLRRTPHAHNWQGESQQKSSHRCWQGESQQKSSHRC